ncbi:MAG: SUMF1/EgtB/PvdO family nonheme iron enzyme [Acidobacteriota bacterium]
MQIRSLRSELAVARQQTDILFDMISPDALYRRPVAERHRFIFYLGHLDAFDWNLLARRSMGERSFHPGFDRLFERGIDPAAGDGPADTPGDWPGRTEVERYNATARSWIDSHLDDLDPWIVQMAIEHRLMHAETLAYLMHNLPYDDKRGDKPCLPASAGEGENAMVKIAGGSVTLGKSRDSFGWDNEHPATDVQVAEFGISQYKISNGEYLAFVSEGGEAPNFWAYHAGEWWWRGMFGMVPLPLQWPVWVNWRQANAYAKWRGLELPSEAQWQRAAGLCAPNSARDNFGFERWDPISVVPETMTRCAAPAQMTGNGWEWTRDLFAPFAGFEAHPFYAGYSADFFDGQHYVMKGASPRTARLMVRPSFRNWFRPEYPYMYAGFRLVED